jgi:hypothetical protein
LLEREGILINRGLSLVARCTFSPNLAVEHGLSQKRSLLLLVLGQRNLARYLAFSIPLDFILWPVGQIHETLNITETLVTGNKKDIKYFKKQIEKEKWIFLFEFSKEN